METASGLIIPSQEQEEAYVCHYCSERIPRSNPRGYRAHVLECDRQHGDELGALAEARQRNPLLSIQDTEQYEWLRRDALRKGLKGIRGVPV